MALKKAGKRTRSLYDRWRAMENLSIEDTNTLIDKLYAAATALGALQSDTVAHAKAALWSDHHSLCDQLRARQEDMRKKGSA